MTKEKILRKLFGKPLEKSSDRGKLLTVILILGFIGGTFDLIDGVISLSTDLINLGPDFYYGFIINIAFFALNIGIWRWSKKAVYGTAALTLFASIVIWGIFLYGQSFNGIQFYTQLIISQVIFFTINYLLFRSIYHKWHLFH